MREVQATEAKAHLAQLLTAVEQGESFAITRHGKAVAHLVPAAVAEQAASQAAVERFRARRARWGKTGFTVDDILAARHDKHRA
ncbi:type II toxin-antitoxin system prevent-host-death family antitoxin [Leptolyngbya sp. 15MV]|nr:type II toxin-antitoxin system prevent-host-death family antitoxin [Leptolyngbya sp. 15MV]